MTNDSQALETIMREVVRGWPEHERYLQKSLGCIDGAERDFAESLAGMLLSIAGDDLGSLCANYRWTCERLLEEEIHFRRTGGYRLSNLADACAEVYYRPDFMGPYLDGLLLSQLLWSHHREVMRYYRDNFLSAARGTLLEVGPGHGLLLHLAVGSGRLSGAVGWDISATSLERTRNFLAALGAGADKVRLEDRDILASATEERFDRIVISEVLEHMEEPERALAVLRDALAPDGLIFVNVPVNSPAPDHIRLFKSPEEVRELVTRQGYQIVEAADFPVTGYSLEKARRHGSTISCAVIAGKR